MNDSYRQVLYYTVYIHSKNLKIKNICTYCTVYSITRPEYDVYSYKLYTRLRLRRKNSKENGFDITKNETEWRKASYCYFLARQSYSSTQYNL